MKISEKRLNGMGKVYNNFILKLITENKWK